MSRTEGRAARFLRSLFKNWGRPADSFSLEVDTHLDAVGNFDEGNAAVHPVLLTVEGHCPFNAARTFPYVGSRKSQCLGLGDPTDSERSWEFKCGRTSLRNLG